MCFCITSKNLNIGYSPTLLFHPSPVYWILRNVPTLWLIPSPSYSILYSKLFIFLSRKSIPLIYLEHFRVRINVLHVLLYLGPFQPGSFSTHLKKFKFPLTWEVAGSWFVPESKENTNIFIDLKQTILAPSPIRGPLFSDWIPRSESCFDQRMTNHLIRIHNCTTNHFTLCSCFHKKSYYAL